MIQLATYTDLIKALPVRSQAFRSKRETWEKSLKSRDLPDELDKIFDRETGEVFTSRKDIFEAAKTTPNLEKIVYLTILWGYPTGMRNDYFSSIVKGMHVLKRGLGKVREGGDWKAILNPVDKIHGLGLSTYSKLLYFLDVKVESYDALILDQRLLAVFENKVFDDFSDLAHLKYGNASHYVCYLREMERVARLLDLDVRDKDKLEMFLFTFGSQLKANER